MSRHTLGMVYVPPSLSETFRLIPRAVGAEELFAVPMWSPCLSVDSESSLGVAGVVSKLSDITESIHCIN